MCIFLFALIAIYIIKKILKEYTLRSIVVIQFLRPNKNKTGWKFCQSCQQTCCKFIVQRVVSSLQITSLNKPDFNRPGCVQYVMFLSFIFTLVNAADNKQRDPRMNYIKINIEP